MLTLLAALLVQDAPVVQPFEVQGFRTTQTITIEAPRDEVWEAATGEVSYWWDHTWSGNPAELVIEPRAGGHFYERFEPGGADGMIHADIIFVDAPSTLRMDGPLGLIERSYDLLISWSLEEVDADTTGFTVDLAMHGEIDAELAGIVHGVWTHFIAGRLKTYVEGGCHHAPEEPCAAFGG